MPGQAAISEMDKVLARLRELEAKEVERQSRENELRAGHDSFRALAENLPDVIARFDRNLRCLYVNPAITPYVRFPLAEFAGKTLAEIGFSDAERERFESLALEALNSGRCIQLEEPWRDTALGDRVFHWRLTPEFGKDGQVVSVLAVARDVTERTRAERELIRTRAAAEIADRAKGEFLGNMSHELRTPLNVVLGSLQLLEMTRLDDEQREFVKSGIEAGNGLLRMLSDILDLSKVQAGLLAPVSAGFSPAGLAAQVAEAFAGPARDKGLALGVSAGPEVPERLFGDECRIRQILFNLVGNAVKFTEHGEVLIAVACPPGNVPPGKTRLTFNVTDTGVGIPKDRLAHVFTVFTQADGSLTRKYQGLGLGLAVVRRMVDLLGGSVVIDSQEGRGTTVLCELCLDLAPARSAGVDVPPAAAFQPKPGGLRLLIVEDDSFNRFVLAELLRKAGHGVVAAENGKQALELLGFETVDAVLLDIRMPVMDGLEAIRRIRAGEAGAANAAIPVIAVTAHAGREEKAMLIQAGADGCLVKPVEAAALERAIREAVAAASA